MKKIFTGVIAGVVLSTSMGAFAVTQDIPAGTMAQFKQEVQQQSDIVNLSKAQSETLLELKADLYRHNSNLKATHGHDDHSMRILGRANQNRYDTAFASLLTEEQKKAVRDHELVKLRQQVPANFMARFEKQVREEGKVLKFSDAEKQTLLEMKMDLYTQQQAANREFPNDKQARDAARRANRSAYNAEFDQMTTQKQRTALQKWRKKQRNA